MRSRAFQVPAAVRFAYLSAPPPASALVRRASYSANKVSYAIAVLFSPVLCRGFPYENAAFSEQLVTTYFWAGFGLNPPQRRTPVRAFGPSRVRIPGHAASR